jgi:uncharacterized membrane protein (UPF0182 family)
MVMGNQVIYTDTYEQALAQLNGLMQGLAPSAAAPGTAAAASPPVVPGADPRIESIRQHLRRYREFAAQGKWAEAGRELEAVEAEVTRR